MIEQATPDCGWRKRREPMAAANVISDTTAPGAANPPRVRRERTGQLGAARSLGIIDCVGFSAAGAFLELSQHLEAQRDATGILSLTSDGSRSRVGEIVFNEGKICVVTHASGQKRLGELVAARYPELAPVVTSALHQARAERRLLGPVLVNKGVPVEALRECLVRQVTSGLLSMVQVATQEPLRAHFFDMTGVYDPHLSFRPAEVYLTAISELRHPTDDPIEVIFDEVSASSETSVLFYRCQDISWAPVAVRSHEDLDLPQIRELTRFAARTARPPALVAADISPRIVAAGTPRFTCVLVATPQRCVAFGGLKPAAKGRVFSLAADPRWSEAWKDDLREV